MHPALFIKLPKTKLFLQDEKDVFLSRQYQLKTLSYRIQSKEPSFLSGFFDKILKPFFFFFFTKTCAVSNDNMNRRATKTYENDTINEVLGGRVAISRAVASVLHHYVVKRICFLYIVEL